MQTKQNNMYYLILMICLIASCICSDIFKTDGMVVFTCASNESKQTIAACDSISNEDICTVKMLGNTHNSLLTQQTAKHNYKAHKKSETLFGRIDNFASLHSLFKFFTSKSANICIFNANFKEIIVFIHNKDGKKRV